MICRRWIFPRWKTHTTAVTTPSPRKQQRGNLQTREEPEQNETNQKKKEHVPSGIQQLSLKKKASFASSTPFVFLGCGDSQYLGIYPPPLPPKNYACISFEKNPFLLEDDFFFEMNEHGPENFGALQRIHSFIFWWKISQVSSIFGLWSLLQVVKMAPESEAFQFGG